MKFTYCPKCGRKNTIEQKNTTYYVCHHCNWEFWNNPKAAVSVVFINDKGELLFAKRAHEPDKGKYDFPGGFVEYNEDPILAAIREIHEETGVVIESRSLKLIAVYTLEYLPGISAADIIMVSKKWKGEFRAADDVADLEWKPTSFMESTAFRPSYPNLNQKIATYLSE